VPSPSIAQTANWSCSTQCVPAGRADVRQRSFPGKVRAGGQLLAAAPSRCCRFLRRPTRPRHGGQKRRRHDRPAKAANAPPGSFAFSGHDRTHAHMIQSRYRGSIRLHATWVWTNLHSGSSTTGGNADRRGNAFDVLPPGDARGTSTSTQRTLVLFVQEEGSNIGRLRLRAPRRDGSPPGRRSLRCRPALRKQLLLRDTRLQTASSFYAAIAPRQHRSFSVGPDGRLSYVGEEWTRAITPQFQLRPPAIFSLLQQRGDNIAVFRVDRKPAGSPSRATTTPVGNPRVSCFSISPKCVRAHSYFASSR